jgi:hypothetical protein
MDMLNGVKLKQCREITDKQAAKILKKFLKTHHNDLEAQKLNVQHDVEAQLQLILAHLQNH